jgi:hypothetical protein
VSLLVLEVMFAPLLAAQTASQLWAGVTFPAGQIVGPVAGFATVALIAIWVLIAILRHVAEPAPARTGQAITPIIAPTPSRRDQSYEGVGSSGCWSARGRDRPDEAAEPGRNT